MMKRVVIGALMGALMVVTTGCSEECTDRFDCSDKGSAGEGKVWQCVNNKCQAENEPVTPPGNTDAGTDAGTGGGTDAGTDAGTGGGTDAGTDAGTPDMSIAEGSTCATTASCMGGLYCDSTKKCAPLHIAVTTSTNNAVVVTYKAPSAAGGAPTAPASATPLTDASTSRYPRWNKDGTAVAFVEGAEGIGSTLVARTLPLTAGQRTELTNGTAADTTDFRYMEWAPSTYAVWSRTAASTGTTGLWYVGAGSAAQKLTDSGVFPSWSGDGNSVIYSGSGVGLQTRAVSGTTPAVPTTSTTTSEQPLYNRTNTVVLYLDAKGQTQAFGTESTPLTELYTSGSATPLAARTEETISGAAGPVRSFIANHTWAAGGTHVAYVRVYYTVPATGAVLCNGSNCGTRQGNVIYVRRVDGTGLPSDATEWEFATEATLPSFSPDGRFMAYLSGGKLNVVGINPTATTADTFKLSPVISHAWGNVQSSRGDDNRPRWQPR